MKWARAIDGEKQQVRVNEHLAAVALTGPWPLEPLERLSDVGHIDVQADVVGRLVERLTARRIREQSRSHELVDRFADADRALAPDPLNGRADVVGQSDANELEEVGPVSILAAGATVETRFGSGLRT